MQRLIREVDLMPRRATPHRAARCLLLLFLAGLTLAAVPAQARSRHARRTRTTPPATAPVAPRMSVAIEPETGALVPDRASSATPLTQAERIGLMRASAGLREVRLPDGGVMVDLQGRFQEFSVAGVGPDGCLRFGCLNGDLPFTLWWRGSAPRGRVTELEVR
jgi:hypothetical protein